MSVSDLAKLSLQDGVRRIKRRFGLASLVDEPPVVRKRERDDDDDWGYFADPGLLKRRPDGSCKVSRTVQTAIEFGVTPQLLCSALYLTRYGSFGACLHLFWAVAHFVHALFVNFGPDQPDSWVWSYKAHRLLDYVFFITLGGAPLVVKDAFGPHALKFALYFGVFSTIFCFGFDPETPEFPLSKKTD